jgi:hypothetical protein
VTSVSEVRRVKEEKHMTLVNAGSADADAG